MVSPNRRHRQNTHTRIPHECSFSITLFLYKAENHDVCLLVHGEAREGDGAFFVFLASRASRTTQRIVCSCILLASDKIFWCERIIFLYIFAFLCLAGDGEAFASGTVFERDPETNLATVCELLEWATSNQGRQIYVPAIYSKALSTHCGTDSSGAATLTFQCPPVFIMEVARFCDVTHASD